MKTLLGQLFEAVEADLIIQKEMNRQYEKAVKTRKGTVAYDKLMKRTYELYIQMNKARTETGIKTLTLHGLEEYAKQRGFDKMILNEGKVDFSKMSASRREKIAFDSRKDLKRYKDLAAENERVMKEYGHEDFVGAAKSYAESVKHLEEILDTYEKYMGTLNEAVANESDFIKSTKERTLTAKGTKFLWKCIDIVAEMNGLNKYSKELKPVKEKLSNLIYHLFIDKKMTDKEIIEVIKNRKVDVGLNEGKSDLEISLADLNDFSKEIKSLIDKGTIKDFESYQKVSLSAKSSALKSKFEQVAKLNSGVLNTKLLFNQAKNGDKLEFLKKSIDGVIKNSKLNEAKEEETSAYHRKEADFWASQLNKRGSAVDKRAKGMTATEIDEQQAHHERQYQILKKKGK